MPSDQKPASPDQVQLAEYQVLDRVEGRLWSRVRMILIVAVVLVLAIVLLGVPLIEERIERRVTERAERLMTERLAAAEVDLPALRQELRNETHAQQQELLRAQFALEKRIASLREHAAALEEASSSLTEGADEFETFKGQIRLIQQTQKNEEERLHRMRTTYEKELSEFREQSQTLLQQIPRLTARELKYLEDVVNRDLDELRLIIADQVEDKPAIFSTYVNLDQRDGQITGANFGGERGNVFVRVRAFVGGVAEPFHETDSILVQSTQWKDSRINLRFPAPAIEKIQAAKQLTANMKNETPTIRYGFVVQTSTGKMSQWSGLRVDSIIPPTNAKPTDD